jgi:hypothetical protein
VDAKDENNVHPTEIHTYLEPFREDRVSHKIMGTLRTTLGIMGTEVRELWER